MMTAVLLCSVALVRMLRPIAGANVSTGIIGAALAIVAVPVPMLICGAAATVVVAGRWRRKKARRSASALTAALLVGTAAGLSLQAALERARSALDARSAAELEAVLRDARRRGLAAALESATGDLAPLLGRLSRSQTSGAPLTASIEAYAAEDRQFRKAAAVERARKLPVRLVVPLALLILPGFMLLTAAPAAVGFLSHMLGPLLP